MPKISVIIPVYNVKKYLPECLDSVVGQTLHEIEIICIDDGSTDGSSDILDEYARLDQRIKVVHKENSGYGSSMNVGLEIASGEYIGIVESDDFADREMFEEMYKTAIKDDADVLKSNYYTFSDEKTEFFEAFERCIYNRAFCPREERAVFFTPPSIWSGIYKRSFLDKNQIRFTETPGASYQDTSFIFKVWASAQKAVLIQKAYIHYRIDNSNSSVNSSSKIFCVCDEYISSENYLNEHFTTENKVLMPLLAVLKYKTYVWNYERLAPEFQYSFLLSMTKEFLALRDKGILQRECFLDNATWDEVNQIADEPDAFFRKTAKIYLEKRLENKPELNYRMYENGFQETLKQYEHVIIYGAGVVGQQVLQYLKNHQINNILSVAVTDESDNPKEIKGVPVTAISKLVKEAESSVVIVATMERIQDRIIADLNSMHFHNIIAIDGFLIEAMKKTSN